MAKNKLYLVDESVLPPVCTQVLTAKKLLHTGKAKTVAAAAKMAGISRSAFYKYKDCIFSYDEKNGGRIINLHALLADRPGVLSEVLLAFSGNGANILTLNQSIPADGLAPISVSASVDSLSCSVDELIASVGMLDGVKSIEKVSE